jgi:Tfp pilus assembly protein PilX
MMTIIPRQQRGATLLVALIMLVLMTLFALTSFNLGKSSLQIVGNMQGRNEGLAAAHSVIERAVSTTKFYETPSSVFFQPCGNVPNTLCIDTNGDGKPDITVTLQPIPVCVKAKVIQNALLVLTNPNDAGCSMGTSQSFGIVGSATGASMCADSTWEITANTADNLTQAKSTLVHGVGVRVSTDNIGSSCPCPAGVTCP